VPSNGTVVLREAALDDDDDDNDDDDDDDDEFEIYDCSRDTVKDEVERPHYIRTCLADLMCTEKVPQLEAALRILPSLLDTHKVQCEEVALELVRILLNYNSTFDIDQFDQLQLNGLTRLCSNYPVTVSAYLCQQFYERNYTIQQRTLILKTIEQAAKSLSQVEHIHNEMQQRSLAPNEAEAVGEGEGEDEDEDEDEDEHGDKREGAGVQPWRSVIHRRLKLKTTYRASHRTRQPPASRENRFGRLVGHFFFPLMRHIDQTTAHLSLIDGDHEQLLLCELLACLGRLCIHAQNTLPVASMVKQYLELLQTLQRHADAGVRHVVLYAYACCLVSLQSTCSSADDDDMQTRLIQLKPFLDDVIVRDTNTEVQKLARSVRQILLKTLHDITAS
jgi:hypothetical protein